MYSCIYLPLNKSIALTGGIFWCSLLNIDKKLHRYDQTVERRRVCNLKATSHLAIFGIPMRLLREDEMMLTEKRAMRWH